MSRSVTILVFLVVAAAAVIARAQDSNGGLPKNYHTVFENSALAVIHAHYEPHEKVPLHDHSKFPTVYVYLSDSGPVLFSHVEEHPFTVLRPALKAGAYRVSPGRIEKHSAENQGGIPTDFLRVELKEVAIRHFTDEHRGAAPASLARNSDAVEYSNSDLGVERIICVAGSTCAVKAVKYPSALIAFTDTEVESGQAPAEQMKTGEVHWMDAGAAVSITADSDSAAHVLRILLPSSK
jgi:predicted metal-dependent enzyme (double-stranded beta helix superfamily)